ncbi:uncharacterized protein LOC112517041 isoform X2 [Cynara cardunculus var. scolymus]|uniref:Uncharacterized protein n=1 Tax=Cynara cardunculus var. scolymus TaxID=59895 RepID=A0A103XM83_CYNCS|nr:uncharacterized protein LOC112517041 isoform X2 [Cynara cardunculus var. scolymus]KVH93411.1 hypothetical protein Ccrd_004535 [Cynara cardunculus var. scolymus]
MMELPQSPIPLAPLLLRNILLPLFIYTDKSLLNLTHKFKLFEILRYTLVTAFVFFLKIVPTFIPSSLNPNHTSDFSDIDSDSSGIWVPFLKGAGKCNETADSSLAGDTCIARALSQLLAIVNEIPVSSRKYDIVRSYAEKLMDENLEEGYESLRKVNATVLSGGFSRALGQLESLAVAERVTAREVVDEASGGDGGEVVKKSGRGGYFGLNRAFKTVGHYGDAAWTRFMKRKPRVGGSAEKLSAELLWLAQKLAACGSADEAVRQWASATKLASFALSAQLRLQGSLVKLSALLFKQATCMGSEDDDEGHMEELRKIKMKLLMSWIPFMCRASNGTDTPVLSFHEKLELESVLGELIGSLKHEEEQEKVLALWLHHFTHCQSTDWPNLYLYYTRWCATSRKLLILEGR